MLNGSSKSVSRSTRVVAQPERSQNLTELLNEFNIVKMVENEAEEGEGLVLGVDYG